MGNKAKGHLKLVGKMQQNQGEQRKLYCCQLFGYETADKITELTEATGRTVPKQGRRSCCNYQEALQTFRQEVKSYVTAF